MKKKVKIALASVTLIVVSLAIYIGTYPKSISWEVVCEENKEKYIEVLKKKNIPFTEETDHLGRRWVTVKGYNLEELDILTKEYDDWSNAKYKNKAL